jgi:hypothetical protein
MRWHPLSGRPSLYEARLDDNRHTIMPAPSSGLNADTKRAALARRLDLGSKNDQGQVMSQYKKIARKENDRG